MAVLVLILLFKCILGQERVCTTNNPCNNEFIIEPNINKFMCLHDKSCFNSSIIINNDDQAQQNVHILCHGISACELASINASNDTFSDISGVTSFICNAKRACFDADIFLYCEPENGCNIDCIGEEACAQIGFGFRNPSFIQNANKYTCTGNQSCAGMELDMVYTIENKVVTFDIDGDSAFKGSMIIIEGPRAPFETLPGTVNWNCNGNDACSLIQVNTFLSETNILCGENACKGNVEQQADTRFILNNGSGTIKCDGKHSCNGLYLLNFGPIIPTTNIGGSWTSVECIGEGSCEDAIFITQCNFINGCNIVCNGVNSCKNFIIGGLYGVSSFECDKLGACSNVTSPASIRDDFIIKCGPSACIHGNFEFYIDPDGLAPGIPTGISNLTIQVPTNELPVSTIKGIECSGIDSCAYATFRFIIFSNNEDTGVETVTCGDPTSCFQSTFIFETANTTTKTWNIDTNTVFRCNGFCDTIKAIFINGKYIPTSNLIGFNVIDESNNENESNDSNLARKKDIIGVIVAGGLTSIVILVGVLVLMYKLLSKFCIQNPQSPSAIIKHVNTTSETCMTLTQQIDLNDTNINDTTKLTI